MDFNNSGYFKQIFTFFNKVYLTRGAIGIDKIRKLNLHCPV